MFKHPPKESVSLIVHSKFVSHIFIVFSYQRTINSINITLLFNFYIVTVFMFLIALYFYLFLNIKILLQIRKQKFMEVLKYHP